MKWSGGHYWEMVRKYLADKRIPVIFVEGGANVY